MDSGKSPDEVTVDLKLTIMKEIGARWLVSMYEYIQNKPEICRNGFRKTGIAEAMSSPESIATFDMCDSEDPFSTASSSG